MQEAKRGKHERRRRSLFATLSRGKDAAARKLRRLPSIVTGETYSDRERAGLNQNPLRSSSKRLDYSGELICSVVVHKADPHQTARLQHSQPPHNLYGVIVAGPDIDPPAAQRVLHLVRSQPRNLNGKRRCAVEHPQQLGRAR